MIDVIRTVISQYGNSPTLLALIENLDQNIDPRANFEDFYNFVWNVDTAQGFGLDIWGRIVNVSRFLQLPTDEGFWGFSQALPGSHTFGEAPFYSGTEPTSQTYALSDDAYRKLILAKALANISRVSAPAINSVLNALFAGRGRCYVRDSGGMELYYVFEFELTTVEYAIVVSSGVLPRPAGVLANILQFSAPLFGFSEAGPSAFPFDEGVFIP